ncbi:hypothetical protein DV737_g4022, partial [Chaetothyriales sp. CBS 132003]
MAASFPPGLKSADISRFALRAGQLEKAKPIAAYWCNYWIVNQILSKGLHETDQECLGYTSTLMDRLEKFKAENADEAAVADDVAGKAYIEQLGLETFARAENAVRANKASRQTADTFNAASTFLDLLAIWGPVEPEITTKAKYAKFHAVRIAKAIKAGEDPNLSNPAPTPVPDEAVVGLDPDDADPSVVEIADDSDEKQRALAHTSTLDQSIHPSRDASVGPVPLSQLSQVPQPPQAPHQKPRQPSVTEVPDEADRLSARLAQQSALDQSLHPSRAPSLPRETAAEVSPVARSDAAFYSVPRTNSALDTSTLETTPPRAAPLQPLPGPVAPAPPVDLPSPPAVPSLPPVPSSQSLPSPPAVPSLLPALSMVVDEEAMAKAQKHARWAISALNFEDVPTAIRELRAALADLGG